VLKKTTMKGISYNIHLLFRRLDMDLIYDRPSSRQSGVSLL